MRISTGALSIGLAIVVVGCNSPRDINSVEPVDSPSPLSPRTLAVVQLASEHQLKFVEFASGFSGWIEEGASDQDVPIVTRELRSKTPIELFRHFNPGAEVPQSLLNATRAAASVSAIPAQGPAPLSDAGKGPHFYNDGEQAWFRNTYCNGAQACAQGWDWVWIISPRITTGSGIAMVGSEGTQNATFSMHWYDCTNSCDWNEFWSAIVVPGHWVSVGVNATGHQILWDLAGLYAEDSLAASYQ